MKTITVCNSKGGVGKSTLAWNLAIALRMIGHRVALVDIDIQQLTITKTSVTRTASGYEPFPVITASSIDKLTRITQSSKYDITIIDAGGYDYDLGRVAISLSDRIVVPINDDPTELFGFITFTQFLAKIEETSPVPPLLAVISRAHPRASRFESIHGIINLWPRATIADTVIRRRIVYAASMGRGFGVAEKMEKYPAASDEIILLAQEVIG